jgi:hypothetical protein
VNWSGTTGTACGTLNNSQKNSGKSALKRPAIYVAAHGRMGFLGPPGRPSALPDRWLGTGSSLGSYINSRTFRAGIFWLGSEPLGS